MAQAQGCDEFTLVGELDELWQRQIIREHGEDAYDFSHDKLREVAYYGMSSTRRRLYHQRITQALETLHGMELDAFSRQIAVHYEQAGLAEKPFLTSAQPMWHARFANEEATSLIHHGLALVEEVRLITPEKAGNVTKLLQDSGRL